MPSKKRPSSAGCDALKLLQRELALGFRMLGDHGLGLGLLAHLTARLPGGDTFWTYQLGMSVEEVRVQDLAEARADATPVDPACCINPSMAIHGDIYAARPDVMCVAHHHGDGAVALGSIGCNLMPYDRSAGRWYGEIDIAEDFDAPEIKNQGPSLVATLGQKKALLLKHHGVLVTGHSIRDAVVATIELERCCAVQLKAMAAGQLHTMPRAEIDDCKKFLASDTFADGTWDYYSRRLARRGLADIA